MKWRTKFLIILNILLLKNLINKLTEKISKAKLKQAGLVNKTNFDNKLTGFNRKITLNKTKYLEVQEKLDSLKTKDNNFL